MTRFTIDEFVGDLAVLRRTWAFAGIRGEGRAAWPVEVGHKRGFVIDNGHDLQLLSATCPHRAGPIQLRGGPENAALQCAYHGWRFDSAGRLVARPGWDGWGEQPIGDEPGPAISLACGVVEACGNVVFASWEPPIQSLSAWLGDTASQISNALGQQPTVVGELEFEFACNWKLYVENWLEGYHIPWLHPEMASVVRTRTYDVECKDGRAYFRASKTTPDSPVISYEGLWVWLPYCTGVNFYDRGVSIESVVPMAHDSTVVRYAFLQPTDGLQPDLGNLLDLTTRVTTQDGRICEEVHANLQRDPDHIGVLSPAQEQAVSMFQRDFSRSRQRLDSL